MSKEALAKVVQRSISDAAFRRQLAKDPSGALRGYDLSGDEQAALRSGDAGRLTAFGVEQRMSKMFVSTDETVSSGSISSAHTSEGSPTGSGALTTGDAIHGNSASAVFTAGGSATSQVLSAGEDGGIANRAETGGDGPMASSDDVSDDPALSSVIPTGGTTVNNDLSAGTDDGYLPTIGYATDTAFTATEHDGGASTPGESSDGPEVQP